MRGCLMLARLPSNVTWDNIQCEGLQTLPGFTGTIDPEALIEDVAVVIDCLLNFTTKALSRDNAL